LLDQLGVPARCLATNLRFLLEGVKHVHRSREPEGVYGAERIAAKVLDHFHHPCPAKAAQRLRITVFAAVLRDLQGITNMILDPLRESAQVLAT